MHEKNYSHISKPVIKVAAEPLLPAVKSKSDNAIVSDS